MSNGEPRHESTGSVDYYDSVAAWYGQLAAKRAPYLRAVDAIVVDWCERRGSRSVLDLGCGDGSRLAAVAARVPMAAVGIDSSSQMIDAARRQGVNGRVADISEPGFRLGDGERYDVVMSLWNVLGHVGDPTSRAAVLANMRGAVAEGGIVIVDVNNRYNAAAYGWPRVLRNVASDALRIGPRGDFQATCADCDPPVSTAVHLFALGEVQALLDGARLRPVETAFVNYSSGARTGRWQGQILVAAEPVP